MQESIDEGVMDFLKRLWQSVKGPTKTQDSSIQLNKRDVDKIDSTKDDGFSGVDDIIDPADPQLKAKLARIFVRGLRLHKEAEQLGVYDEELLKILAGVWRGKITVSQFLDLKENGIIDRIYARVRERIRYRRRKEGMWYEELKK